MKYTLFSALLTLAATVVQAQLITYDSTGTKTPYTNWTETITYTKAGGAERVHDMTYYNGLGYPMQAIQVRASGNGKNIVTPVTYDSMRRSDARAYLPFASTLQSCRMEVNAVANQACYYKAHYANETTQGNDAYFETKYDSSPLERVEQTIRPGSVYRSPGVKAAQYGYDICGNEEVLYLEYSDYSRNKGLVSNLTPPAPWLKVKGYYPQGALTKSSVTDEDGTTMHTFTDGQGRTLLSRTQTPEGTIDTYYVYDFAGSLGWVVTPEGATQLEIGKTYTGDSMMARDFSYYYQYDKNGRMAAKHLPGRDNNEFFMYDHLSRLAKHCDGNYRYHFTDFSSLPPLYRAARIKDPGFGGIEITPGEYYTHFWNTYEYDAHNRIVRQWRFTGYNIPTAVDTKKNVTFYKLDSTVVCEYRYDSYTGVPAALAFAAADTLTAHSTAIAGYKVYEKLKVLDNSSSASIVPHYHQRAFYYDSYGRLCQRVELTAGGDLLRQSYCYDFSGNPLHEIESVLPAGAAVADIKHTSRSYDSRSRLLSETTQLNGNFPAEVRYRYDDLGRLEKTEYGASSSDEGPIDPNELSEIYSYNLQGWLQEKMSPHFSQRLRYSNPQKGATPKYTGQISEISWGQSLLFNNNTYRFNYDVLGRLLGTDHFEHDSLTQRFTERGIDYDLNGNILRLDRSRNGAFSHAEYEYKGSRLHRIWNIYLQSRNMIVRPDWPLIPERDTTSFPEPEGPIDPEEPLPVRLPDFAPYPLVAAWAQYVQNDADPASGGDTCRYDVNGNMTYDPRTGLSMTYNDLNLLKNVSQGAIRIANYSYLYDHTKLSAVNGANAGYVYLGSLVYKKTGAAGVLKFESTAFAGGRIVAVENVSSLTTTHYHFRDHLGSTRAVVAEAEARRTLIERNEYFPFGLRWDVPEQIMSDNRHRFNGKEEQAFLNIPWLDYGARMYDPNTGRWLTMDQLAEKYFGINPYVFCANNPVRFLDRDGRDWVDKIMGGAIGLATNVIPGTTGLRETYAPNDASDYNNALQFSDAAAMVIGGGMLTGGQAGAGAGMALVVGGGATAATVVGAPAGALAAGSGATIITGSELLSAGGVVVMANASANKAAGYNYGDAPKANEGGGNPHGNADHNGAVDRKVKEVQGQKGVDIRKNQQQVNAKGKVVGRNRPDVQWTDADGVHHNYEVDRKLKNNQAHERRIRKNDPNARYEYDILNRQ